MRRKLVKKDKSQIIEMDIQVTKLNCDERRDEGITLWNVVLDYVKENWPKTEIFHGTIKSICVVDDTIIIDSNTYPAADPNLFKYIDEACKKGMTLSKGSVRKLKSQWRMEQAADLLAIHAVDVEDVMKSMGLK